MQAYVYGQADDWNTETHVRQIILYSVIIEIVLHGGVGANLNVTAHRFYFILAGIEPFTRLIDDDGIVGRLVELLTGQRQSLTGGIHPCWISVNQSIVRVGSDTAFTGDVLVERPANDGVAAAT